MTDPTDIPRDPDGFLADPAQWTPELAARLAELEGVGELGEEHWRVIDLSLIHI